MNRSFSPHSPMNPDHPPSDVDRWLGAYFQAQMPKPFPPAPRTTFVETARPRQASNRGRWTLAAAVAASLVLGISLSYGPSAPTKSGDPSMIQDATADGKKLQEHMPAPSPVKMP